MKNHPLRTQAVIFLSFIFIVSVSGCAAISGPRATDDASRPAALTAKVLKFDDVPVPAGFKLLDNESFVFENDQMRVGLLKYTGFPDANRVVEFYKEQMPMYNWGLVNVIEYGQRVMNFERPNQSCIITIQPASTRTIIAIAVAPKAGTPMTAEKAERYKVLKQDHPGPAGAK